MTEALVVSIMVEAMRMATILSAPVLIGALVVGLLVSIFQAVTQIHEMTLTFIPKILAVGGTIILILPWMVQRMLDFTHRLLASIPTMVG